MNEESTATIVVRAKHNFAGKNNDELCFKKGDNILITQKTDEGWWEGTLNGKTGWFPSNYVTETKAADNKHSRSKSPTIKNNPDLSVNNGKQQQALPTQDSKWLYRKMVLQDLIESERSHVEELENLLDNYLKPLQSEKLLTDSEFTQLIGNIEQIMQHQLAFLKIVEDHIKKPNKEQRVGGEFMKHAPTLKTLLKIYCENHPLAVEVLTKHRDALTNFMNKKESDIMTLTTGLSRPFRHLDKYPNVLQELERNIEENHPDRGDTQRAVSVFRDLANFCKDVRKQKELQLELLSGTITGWDGPSFSTLGEILYMRSVSILSEEGGERLERFLVLFTDALFILQISHKLNSYVFKKRLELDGIVVKKPADVNGILTGQQNVLILQKKNATKELADLTMVLPSGEELNRWIELFSICEGVTVDDSCTVIYPTSPILYSTVQPQLTTMPSPGYAELVKKQSLPLTSKMERSQTSSLQSPTSPRPLAPRRFGGYCLRPLAPHRVLNESAKNNVKLRKKEIPAVFDQEETELLKVVEAYCTNAGGSKSVGMIRKNANSPHLLVAEDEKIFVEEFVGDEVVLQEKTLVDTVYSLKDQINDMKEDIKKLTKMMEDEQRARRRMEEIIRRLMLSQRNSTPKLLQMNGDDTKLASEDSLCNSKR